jgi:hypothetical protein
MKKIIFFVILFLLIVDDINAQYIRKIKEPDFFMPENAKLHKQEKLPSLNIKKIDNGLAETQKNFQDNNLSEKEKVSYNKSLYDIREVPDYKNKYDEYIRDIKIYDNTKQMPENPELEKDLAKMNSNERKILNTPSPQKITSEEMGNFYKIYKQIMDN